MQLKPILNQLPTTHEFQGLTFTFEKWRCLHWCNHEGTFIGQYSGDHYSQRVGLCPKSTGLTFPEWEKTYNTVQHVTYILKEMAKKAEYVALDRETPSRSSSGIIIESFERGQYSIRIANLTRDQALVAYRAALDALED